MLAAALAVLLAAPAAAQRERSSYDSNPGILRMSGFVIFFGVQGPVSYEAPTPSQLPPGAAPAGEVKGKACQHGLSIPLGLRSFRLSGGLGKGGFERALAGIRREHPGLRGVYDAKVDDHIVSVLGVYQRLCTEVTAWGFR